MYIVIAGGGISGSILASALAERKHDVVVIDLHNERCEAIYAQSGVITVNGNSTDINTLKAAGIEKANIAIGAMYSDPANLTFAILAKSFKVQRIMVKMRDPAYARVYEAAGISSVCNMIELFRNKILMELENPNVRIISNLEDRNTQLIMIRYPGDDPDKGITIMELARKDIFSEDCVFAGIFQNKINKIIMPRGADKVYPDDKLFIVAHKTRVKIISNYIDKIVNKQQKK